VWLLRSAVSERAKNPPVNGSSTYRILTFGDRLARRLCINDQRQDVKVETNHKENVDYVLHRNRILPAQPRRGVAPVAENVTGPARSNLYDSSHRTARREEDPEPTEHAG